MNQRRGNFYRVIQWVPNHSVFDEIVNVGVVVYGEGTEPAIRLATNFDRAIRFALDGNPRVEEWARGMPQRLDEFAHTLFVMDDLSLHTWCRGVYGEFELREPFPTIASLDTERHNDTLLRAFVVQPEET